MDFFENGDSETYYLQRQQEQEAEWELHEALQELERGVCEDSPMEFVNPLNQQSCN